MITDRRPRPHRRNVRRGCKRKGGAVSSLWPSLGRSSGVTLNTDTANLSALIGALGTGRRRR